MISYCTNHSINCKELLIVIASYVTENRPNKQKTNHRKIKKTIILNINKFFLFENY